MSWEDILAADALNIIYQHAIDVYPEECCGFVLSDATVHLGTNIQDLLNQRRPDIYRRTAANGYTFSVEDALLLNRSFKCDNPVRVIYHSHPDVGAYFSREDEDKALFMGQPIFPVAYLVVDVRDAGVFGAKLFKWDGGGFACSHEFVNQATHV